MGNKKKNNSNSKPKPMMPVGMSINHVASKPKRGRTPDVSNSKTKTSKPPTFEGTQSQNDNLADPVCQAYTGPQTIVPVVQAQLQDVQQNSWANKVQGNPVCKSTFNDPQEQHNFQIRAEAQANQELMNQLEITPKEQQHSRKNKWIEPQFEPQQTPNNDCKPQSTFASKTGTRKKNAWVEYQTESNVSHSGAKTQKDAPVSDFNQIEQNPEDDCDKPIDPSENQDVACASDDFQDNDPWFDNTPKYEYPKQANYENKHREFKSKKFQEDWRSPRTSAGGGQNLDEDYEKFDREYERNYKSKIEFKRVSEKEADLFAMPKEFSLAHCVAEDMNMGSGIAVQFRREFKRVDDLLDQKVRQGGVAFLEVDGRYVYYLVTKRESSGKPTYEKFYLAVKKWRDLVLKHGVTKLAIPRMGCGLDRLEWDKVKYMIETLFKDVDCEIVVCNFQQAADENAVPAKVKNCKVVNVEYPLSQIESGTILIFLCSEDSHVTEEMQDLDKKFQFMPKFRQNKRVLGEPIILSVQNGNYVLCGCVVKKSSKDDIEFSKFQSSIQAIAKWNRKEQYSYVGFQAIEHRDNQMNKKLLNLIRNTFKQVEVYVCWTGNMAKFMPPSRG